MRKPGCLKCEASRLRRETGSLKREAGCLKREARRLNRGPGRVTSAPATTWGRGYSRIAPASKKPAPAAAITSIDLPNVIRGFRSWAT